MYIGYVIGNVTATIKHPALHGHKLLLVSQSPLLSTEPDNSSPPYDICLDLVQAGPGDQVLILDEGSSARQLLNDPSAPVRAVIVAIIDSVNIDPC
ncbi:MAG TPA: EutN/CcmL family microcompartment protein [Anaerolineae bacterium]|nr:EutN/CcmL family microcompartment protein [Anaerolineae bacterium]